MTDVERIVRRLSADQREALASPEWSMTAQYETGILELLRYGLLGADGWGHKLTPLGLQVRAALEKEMGE